jgi:hypothetical protein
MQVLNTDVQIHKNNNKPKKKVKNEFHKCHAKIEKQNPAGRHQMYHKGYFHQPYIDWSRVWPRI